MFRFCVNVFSFKCFPFKRISFNEYVLNFTTVFCVRFSSIFLTLWSLSMFFVAWRFERVKAFKTLRYVWDGSATGAKFESYLGGSVFLPKAFTEKSVIFYIGKLFDFAIWIKFDVESPASPCMSGSWFDKVEGKELFRY